MKYLKLSVLLLVLLVTGFAIAFRSTTIKDRPTEPWLDTQVPTTIGKFYVTGDWKMDKETYDILKAYGIISRFMSNGQQNYDTVFLASDNSASFHDPRICFDGQYNDILAQETDLAPTKTLGKVPVTVLLLKNLRTQTLNYAAYCFKGPGGYFADQDSQHFDLFRHELLTATPQEGAFYRIIDLNGSQGEPTKLDKANILTFIGQYMDAIHARSKGRF